LKRLDVRPSGIAINAMDGCSIGIIHLIIKNILKKIISFISKKPLSIKN
jgi:hypothetical protein